MKRWSLLGALVAGFVMLAALPDGGRVAASPAAQQSDADFTADTFVRVIDGDSVEFWRNETRWGVGLVGVTTPMGNTPCGQSATGRMWELTGGGVRFVAEAGTDLDARGRRMYHAYAADGTSIAMTLVAEGWVRASREKSSVRNELVQAEAEARRENRGCLWGDRKGPRGFERKQPAKEPKIVADSSVTGPAAIAERDPVGIGDGPIANAVSVSGYQDLLIVGGFNQPTAFEFLPDGRILVAEKHGVVKIRANGVTSTVIDISNLVNDYWDHGLIGLAVDPDFTTNGWIYLGFTYEHNQANYSGTKTARLIRVTMVGNSASIGSAETILGSQNGDSCDNLPAGADCIPSDSPSHSIGTPEFGPDGMLYLTTGDGAHFNYVDPRALRAQDLNTFSGKVIRVNKDGTAPPDNPYYTGSPTDLLSKVYASGLRNPFRNNFNPATGRLYLGDVGWGTREEVSVARPGSNFGWPCYEGSPQQSGYSSYAECQALYAAGASAHTRPLIEWGHVGGSSAAVGGAFASSYTGAQQNAYFYGDYGQGFIRYVQVDANDALLTTPQEFATNLESPVSIQRGPDGQIYYAAIGTGEIRYFNSSTVNQQPVAVMSATPTNGLAPLDVSFSAAGTADPDNDPLTYAWDFGDGTTASGASAAKTYDTNGVYTATLTVADGKGGVGTTSAVITVGNRAPTVTIESPSGSLLYKVGDTIQLQASGSDLDDGGALPASALSWTIILHHGTHTHPFATLNGATQSFVVPDHGDDTRFEIVAHGVDSGGLTGSATVNINPQPVQLTLNSDPSGLLLSYDGVLVQTPHVATTVVGSTHTLNATPWGGFVFESWSDGGAQQHNITIGADPLSFTAYYSGHITFDDLSPNVALNGEYPIDEIDWGTGKWFLSGPWAGNTANSASFAGPGITSQTFTFLTPRILTSVRAWNGGSATTVTLACAGNTTKAQSVSGGASPTITTGWSVPCSTVTVTSGNGWNTNFDDLIIAGSPPDDTAPPVFSSVTGTPTSATTATITWTTNEPSTSQVEYGTSLAYGAFAPISADPALVTAHAVQLTGLTPGQAYQFRVRSTDVAGNAGTSANATFSTPVLDSDPPVITNVAHSGITETTATVTWTTDEPSNTQVLFGLTASYGSSAPATPNPALVLSHSQSLTGLLPGTTYVYAVRSADAAGNIATLAGGSFTTASPPPVTTATFNDLSNPDRTLGGQYPSGVIDWGANKWYLSAPYGLFTTNSISFLAPGVTSQTFNFVTPRRLVNIDAFNGGSAATITIACAGNTTRSLSLPGGALQTIATNFTAPCTTVTITSSNGWNTNFDNLTFDSGIIDSDPPAISAVTTTNVTTSAATITWTTDEPANAQVDFGLTTAYGTVVPTTPGAATNTSHSVALSGLAPNTTYFYRVLSRDASGNTGTVTGLEFTTLADTSPPTISGVTTISIGENGATITWSTNEAANAQVDYGLTTGYGTLAPASPGAATNTSHSVSLTGLTANTTYFYRVLSSDASGNTGTAAGFQFTTTAPDETPPSISAVTATGITQSGATITWTTNEAANAQVDFGLTAAYGTLFPVTPGAATNTSHSVALSGLSPATTYFFQVLSRDASGNTGTATGFQFTTAAAPPPNSALQFDGSNDIATAPDSNSLDINGPITIEAWIKMDTAPAGDYHTIAFKRGSASGKNIAYALYYRSGLLFEFRNGSRTWDLNDFRPISTGVWHHVAAVYDRTTIRLFVDGQQTASRAVTAEITSTAGAFSVGANFAWTDEQFDGTIDELRLSAVARYTANFTPPAAFTPDANTRGLWHFDEGTGQTVADASGNGNTLTRGTNNTTETRDPDWVAGTGYIAGSAFLAPPQGGSPALLAAIVPSSSERRRWARAAGPA